MGQVGARPMNDAVKAAAVGKLNEPFDNAVSLNKEKQNKITISKKTSGRSIREPDNDELAAQSPTPKTSLIKDNKTPTTSQVRRHYGTLDAENQLMGTARSRMLPSGRRRNAYRRTGHRVNGFEADATASFEGCIGQCQQSGSCNCCYCCRCPTLSADHPCCHNQLLRPTAGAATVTCANQCQAAPMMMIYESQQCQGLVDGYCQSLEAGAGQTLAVELSGGGGGGVVAADEQKSNAPMGKCRHKIQIGGSSLSSRDGTRPAKLNPISERIEAGNKSAQATAICPTDNVVKQIQRMAPTKQRRHLQCGSRIPLTGANYIENNINKSTDNMTNYVSLEAERKPLNCWHDTSQRQPEGSLSRPFYQRPFASNKLDAAKGDSCGDITVSPSTVSSSSSSSSSSPSSFRLLSSSPAATAAASLLVALNSEESPTKGLANQQPAARRISAKCHESTPCNCHKSSLSAAKSLPPPASERLNSVTGGSTADSQANEIIDPTKSASAGIKNDTLTERQFNEGAELERDSNSTALIIGNTTAEATTTAAVAASASTATESSSGKQTDNGSKNLISQGQQQQQPQQPCASEATSRGHLAWNDLAAKYGRMSRKQSSSKLVGGIKSGAAMHNNGSGSGHNGGGGDDGSDDHNSQSSNASRSALGRSSGVAAGSNHRSNSSCLFHIICALLHTIFPILDSLKNYALPGDLLTDLAAGFTVAVLHIPQGMAYGLLSGVEPIYGLHVSFVPVLVMSLMSKSRHVSYGTFAVISMLLVSTIDDVRSSYEEANHKLVVDLIAPTTANLSGGTIRLASLLPDLVVVTDNHQAPRLDSSSDRSMSAIDDLTIANQQQIRQLQDSGADSTMGPISTLVSATAAPTNIEILACACLVCGVIHITMSLMHLGVLSLMFSDQLVSSFTTASAIHVLTSQLAGLFDLSLAPIHDELFKIARVWYRFTHTILFDGCNQLTGLLSVVSIAFLLLIKQLVEPALRKRFTRLTCLPSELVLMAIVTTCSSYFNFKTHYGVKIIGHVPTGLPDAQVARLDLVPYVIKDSLTIALISFAMNLSIAQVYAKKFRYELDANQELFALGTANIVGSFFNCFPCASSLSRSSVQSSLNVRSQLCSLFSCGLVVLIICFFADILHDLPRSTLSCIIVVALKGILMQITDFYDNWRLSKLDALVWLATFLSVIIFGVTYGLMLGILASLFTVFLRLLTPNHSILGRLPETDIYVDVDEFAHCQEFNGVKIFRFNSALCYLNRTMLKSKIKQLLPSIYKPTGFSAICSKFHQQSQHQRGRIQPVANPPLYASSAGAAEAMGTPTLPARATWRCKSII